MPSTLKTALLPAQGLESVDPG